MTQKSPYQIIKHLYVTEKSKMLENLKDSDKNPSIRKFKSPKFVFLVDPSANKQQIRNALNEIYREDGAQVVDVNTINIKPKPRRVRGRPGFKKAIKKAIVTFRPNDKISVQ